jgi:hypothetical protein
MAAAPAVRQNNFCCMYLLGDPTKQLLQRPRFHFNRYLAPLNDNPRAARCKKWLRLFAISVVDTNVGS